MISLLFSIFYWGGSTIQIPLWVLNLSDWLEVNSQVRITHKARRVWSIKMSTETTPYKICFKQTHFKDTLPELNLCRDVTSEKKKKKPKTWNYSYLLSFNYGYCQIKIKLPTSFFC